MHPDLVRDIAQAIVPDELLTNWRLWVLLIVINGLVAAIGAFGGSFLRKRGETTAIRRDLDQLLDQLKKTTAVATETKTAIERLDWLEREWRATRRQKLELLLSAVYDLETWLEHMREKWLHGEQDKAEPRAIEKVKLLSTLYFPELRATAEYAWKAHADAYQFILEAGSPAGKAMLDEDLDGYEKALRNFTSGWPTKYQNVRDAVASLEAEASELMLKIARA